MGIKRKRLLADRCMESDVDDIYENLVSSIPTGTRKTDAIDAALKFVSHCINQIQIDEQCVTRVLKRNLLIYTRALQDKFESYKPSLAKRENGFYIANHKKKKKI